MTAQVGDTPEEDGPSASAATAAMTGVSSPTSCRSRSAPTTWPVPATVRPSCRARRRRPSVRRSIAARRLAGSCCRPARTVTRPPVTSAARGTAPRCSGPARWPRRRGDRPGTHHPAVRLAVVDLDATVAQHATVMSMWGSEARACLRDERRCPARTAARPAAAPRRTGWTRTRRSSQCRPRPTPVR